MIKRIIHTESYWKVIVYFNVDYDLFYIIEDELKGLDVPRKTIDKVYEEMYSNKAKGVTLSNMDKHISVVLFNEHSSDRDYLNTIVHEAEHVKQAMLKAYRVEDRGEPPAYTIGYLAMKMYDTWIDYIQ